MSVVRDTVNYKTVVAKNIVSITGTVVSGTAALDIGDIVVYVESTGKFAKYVQASYAVGDKLGIVTEPVDASAGDVRANIFLSGTAFEGSIIGLDDEVKGHLYGSQIFAI